MNSFRGVLSRLDSIPVNVTWMLQSIAEKRGHQDLYTRQSPEKLRKLREYAMIESAVASNRIEGVNVDAQRVGTVVFGNGIMRDRDEEEVRGYRKALDLIHESGQTLELSVEVIRKLHALTRPSIWDSGEFRKKECEIIQTYADGSSRVRFKAVAPDCVVDMLDGAIKAYESTIEDGRIPSLVRRFGTKAVTTSGRMRTTFSLRSTSCMMNLRRASPNLSCQRARRRQLWSRC